MRVVEVEDMPPVNLMQQMGENTEPDERNYLESEKHTSVLYLQRE